MLAGLRNLLSDIRNNGGWPSQVDATGFEVGVNMAATPGEVVYRSELIELIQYEPQTPSRCTRYRCCSARRGSTSTTSWTWRPVRASSSGRSSTGTPCFAISYRNPDASMRDLEFDDYLQQGPLDAVRVVREITGAPRSTPCRCAWVAR